MASRKTAASATNAAAGAVPGELSFEQALERLETLVEELEGGSLTLEESIARYEEGVTLSRRLTQTLDEAEKRIERLVESSNDATPPTTVPVELDLKNSGAAGEEELPF